MSSQEQGGGCCVPESEMMVVRDLNMDYPWKSGNQYSRICPECNGRTFTSKDYYRMAKESDSRDAYIIQQGDDEPTLLFGCPYEDCDGEVYEGLDECEDCGGELEWVDEEDDSTEADNDEAEVNENE